jgi:hypothetical protein
MKKGTLLILSVSVITLACFGFTKQKEKSPVNPKGFALIELFTSEGCSSCPPGEAVLHHIIQKAKENSQPVYLIEFHVDYWDYLGWKDTFATPGYSKRQQNYGDNLKLNSIYTPQVIVNGKTEMVGSEEDEINKAIISELQVPAMITIDCKAAKASTNTVEISYTILGNISGCELNFAIVESNLTTYVKKGENARKTLTHDNIARVFKTIKTTSLSGKITLSVPSINLNNAKLICFVQNIENMNIIGATQLGIVQ